MHQSIDKTAATIEPLKDTWGGKKYAGSWTTTPSFDFTFLSTQEVNSWFANSLTNTLDAFLELARVRQVSFGTDYTHDNLAAPMTLEWQLENSYCDFLENVLKEIRKYPAPLHTLDMEVDLFVYVRTQESPDKPIKAWVRHMGEFSIVGGPEWRVPYIEFYVAHTLFFSWPFYEDNSELASLNQPLLENALRRWEERFGPICEIDGLGGIYSYGFRSEI